MEKEKPQNEEAIAEVTEAPKEEKAEKNEVLHNDPIEEIEKLEDKKAVEFAPYEFIRKYYTSEEGSYKLSFTDGTEEEVQAVSAKEAAEKASKKLQKISYIRHSTNLADNNSLANP